MNQCRSEDTQPSVTHYRCQLDEGHGGDHKYFAPEDEDLVRQDRDALKVENAALKDKLSEMNRRCQRAESAALVKVEDCKRQGISLGRGLANWHGSKLQRDLDAAKVENEVMLQWIEDFKAAAADGHDLGQFEKAAHPRWPELLERLRKLGRTTS